MKGLDVSHYQGSVNFQKVKSAGYSFVILKATEGTKYKDPTFERNYKSARSAGLLVGAYHFATFTSPASARKEAQHFKKVLNKKAFDIVPQLDLEKNKAGNQLVASMQAFFNELGHAGLYSFGYFYLDNLVGHHTQPLWYARYASKPIGVAKYAIWQHTSQARVSGIGGWVDENISGHDWEKVLMVSSAKPVAVKSAAPKTTSYYVTATALNIRKTPGGKIIGLLKHNDRVQVINVSAGWARLKSGNHSVYVASRYLSKAKVTAAKPKPKAVYIKVKRGNTVSALARRYGSSIKQIKSWNHLNSKYTIYIGEKIRVK